MIAPFCPVPALSVLGPPLRHVHVVAPPPPPAPVPQLCPLPPLGVPITSLPPAPPVPPGAQYPPPPPPPATTNGWPVAPPSVEAHTLEAPPPLPEQDCGASPPPLYPPGDAVLVHVVELVPLPPTRMNSISPGVVGTVAVTVAPCPPGLPQIASLPPVAPTA